MEFLPILQDFVPYRGRCPAAIEVTIKKTIKEKVEQGKGTGDHLMPLGDWFWYSSDEGAGSNSDDSGSRGGGGMVVVAVGIGCSGSGP